MAELGAAGSRATSRATVPRRYRLSLRGETCFAICLLIPSMIVVFGVVLYPLARTVYSSLFAITSALPGRFPFVGVGNYAHEFAQPEFWSSLGRTCYFTALTTVLELVLGVVLGLLLNVRFRGRAVVRSLVIVPWAVPTVVSGALWRWIYNGDYGALNAALTQVHLTAEYHQWLGTSWSALNMLVIEDVWKFTPLVALFVLAGLQTIPDELREAAMVDGAGPLRRLQHVILPLLMPVLLVMVVLRSIDGFRLFDIVYVMTRGGPANGTETAAFYTYVQAFSNQEFGLGAALSVTITVVILVITVLYMRLLRGNVGR